MCTRQMASAPVLVNEGFLGDSERTQLCVESLVVGVFLLLCSEALLQVLLCVRQREHLVRHQRVVGGILLPRGMARRVRTLQLNNSEE